MATASNARRRRTRWAKLVTVAVTVFLFAVMVEVGFRIVGVTDARRHYWDPVVGPRVTPNESGRYARGLHVRGTYHFNAQGWNHPEDYVKDKPAGVYRVALIGDSQVAALEVPLEQTLFQVAEREVNAAGVSSQWYAFGISGYGISQAHEIIRNYALEYEPDLVVLLFVSNDPFDTSPYIDHLPPFWVRHYLDDQDNLITVPPDEWSPTPWRRLAARSAAVRYFMLQMNLPGRLRNRDDARGIGGLPLREPAAGMKNLFLPGLESLSLAEREEKTWILLEELLESIRDECHRRGARFALAFRGWGDEIDSPIMDESYVPLPQQEDPYCLGKRAREMGRERVAPLAQRLGVPYLDLTEPIRSTVERTGRSHRFPDDNHYSALGHDAAGKALAALALEIRADGPSAQER